MKLSRIDIIATNGNDGLHYKEKRMRKPHEFTVTENVILQELFNHIHARLEPFEHKAKLSRTLAEKLRAAHRKPRTKKPDPNQLSFEDKLVMEETLRGPDYPEEGDAA